MVVACVGLGAGPAAALQPAVAPHHHAVDGAFLASAPEPAERGTVCLVGDGVERTPDTERGLLDRVALPGVRPLGDGGRQGTRLASLLVGSRNGWGVSGLTRGVSVLSVVPWTRRPASEQAAAGRVADAITKCSQSAHPVRTVVLLPFGRSRIDQSALQRAVHAARTAEVTVVAPSGEDPLGGFRWPADVRGVLSVSADSGDACDFPAGRAPLVVPACGIAVPTPQGGVRRSGAGSAVAATLAAGAITALRSHAPELSRREAEAILLRTAGGASAGGPRRVSARRAFEEAGLTGITAEGLTPTSSRLRRPRRPRIRSIRSRGRITEVVFRLPRGARVIWPVGEVVATRSRTRANLRRTTFTRQVLARTRTRAGVIGPGTWVRVPGLGERAFLRREARSASGGVRAGERASRP